MRFWSFIPTICTHGITIYQYISCKVIGDLEDPHLDMYGDLLDESGSSRNPLSNALLQNSIYSKCRVYKDAFLSLNGSSTNQNLDFKPLPPHLLLWLDNASSDNKNHYFRILSKRITCTKKITRDSRHKRFSSRKS